MSTVQRLRLIGAAIALAGVIVGTQVWGDAAGRRSEPQKIVDRKDGAPLELKAGQSSVAARFAEQPVVSYATSNGEVIFGAQIRPNLGAAADLPRDILVLVDTSASQAGTSYKQAQQIIKTLNESLKSGDQLAIWTVNIPSATRNLTNGFEAPRSAKVNDAITRLDSTEYCSGACDLKGALAKAMKDFDVRAGRQQAIVLLGDGDSAYAPLVNADRFQIAQDMANQKIAFFAVPSACSSTR